MNINFNIIIDDIIFVINLSFVQTIILMNTSILLKTIISRMFEQIAKISYNV